MSEDKSDYVAAPKVSITPITFVIEVVAERMSTRGTFSALKVTSVKSSIKELIGHLSVSAPPQGGGSMYIKTDSMNGIKVLKGSAAKTNGTKLF